MVSRALSVGPSFSERTREGSSEPRCCSKCDYFRANRNRNSCGRPSVTWVMMRMGMKRGGCRGG